jgi:hypothetical protein
VETTCALRGTTPDESSAKARLAGRGQEHAMSLRNHQKRQLRRITADLRRSDPHLDAMFKVFGKLYPDQDMPAWEQVPSQPRPGSGCREDADGDQEWRR